MSTTAQDVFNGAMALMDSVDTVTGDTNTAGNAAYKSRTLSIINILRGEVYPYCANYPGFGGGERPFCGAVGSFTDDLGIDDAIAQTVLPYGLASQLLLEENPAAASFFQQRFEELLMRLSPCVPQNFADIEDVYGGIGYGEYGRW